ncbi:hypothetical protein SAMN05216456_1298 [Devosia crocina]|uniref:Uncharacterized protein n=1 Tax=Devosia crocina TaxID=429728 RepID=A0A1I7N9D0_9HYPH|nr:hypothetical protein [Devosia crocina]SFV31304.1 hypothetical protein SAMN05216456_1298 [Devosia crocina]
MAKPDFTDEMLESLSEEERAGLLNPDLVDEGLEAEAAAAADTPSAEDDTSAPAETELEGAVAADGSVTVENAAADEGKPAAVQQPQSLLPAYDLPEDFEARLEAIKSGEDDLEKRFDDGELSSAEYRKGLRELNDQRSELERMQLKHELSADSRKHDFEIRKSTWFENTVPDWLAKHPQYEAGSAGYDALNAEVMKLQGGNAADPFAASILDQAHAKVQRDMRKALGLPAEENKPSTPQPPTEPKREIPPALGGLPSAAPADLQDTSKFAVISRMTGEAKENAMAQLSDTERNQYLASEYA